MNLTEAKTGEDVLVKDVNTDDELKSFLFTLGCYKGEIITLISKKRGGYVLSIKDARYNIDEDLAKMIEVESQASFFLRGKVS